MKKNKTTQFMTVILMMFFVVLYLIIAGRFLYIQATGEINNVSLEEWAKQKRMSSYPLKSERGRIYDSNGTTIAYDRPTYRIYAILDEEFSENSNSPKHIVEPEKTAELLAPILDVEESFILERLKTGISEGRFQIEFGQFGKDLSQKERDEIIELNIPGINFETESIRYYPNGVFAAHVLGFARKEQVEAEEKEADEEDNIVEEIIGVTGIEKEKNDYLKGEDGYISFQRDKFNRKLLDPDEVVKKPINGKSIYLTIEQKVQTLLDDVLTEVEEEYNPERITAAVMNAKTGEIVAMSNRPSYNPNSPTDVQNWYNDVISTPVEPGSTVKMFTWAAAIDAGVYNGDELYESGKYQANERLDPIHDHKRSGWGLITYDEAFRRSSNVAAAKLVWEKLGTEEYLEYLQAFDFDKITNIDLPSEVPGKILFNWPLEKITTSFGQGSTLTPIQQLKAATAITNGGKMLEPYVIKKIVDSDTDEVIEENAPKVVGEPISKEAAEQVLDLLETVVNSKQGTGKVYQLDDYSVAGKTGTAEIPNPNGPGYLSGPNESIYSFLGMAPKDDPQLIMYVSVNQPELKEGELGSTPVSFIFKSVMENALHYLNIEPDKQSTDAIETVEVPRAIDFHVKKAKEKLTEAGFVVTTLGSGEKVIDMSVEEGESLFKGERILIVTEEITMPDVTGWSLREILQLADLLQIEIEPIGNGFVTKQSIKKGSPIKEGNHLEIELEPPNHVQKSEEDN